MSSFSSAELSSRFEQLLPAAFGGRFCVAFSGGIDSAVLLHAMHALSCDRSHWSIRAIHIDHQLQPASGDWAQRCKRDASALGVDLQIERVIIDRNDPRGIEAAARAARYKVFRRELHHGELLLTAHHADDQLETVLLALMRGSGVQGLSAMPAIKAFGRGWHARPLLAFSRGDLETYAKQANVQAIDDPTNATLRHDRNYLRHEVLPALRNRWPSASVSAVRAAAHLGEALELLEEVAVSDLRACAVQSALSIEHLRGLSSSRRRNLLRYWLRLKDLPLPSTRKLFGLEQDLFRADSERIPIVTWQGAVLHWHRGLLYAEHDHIDPTLDLSTYEKTSPLREGLVLPAGLGELQLRESQGVGLSRAKLPAQLVVRFRRGGEKIHLPKREHRHTLRNVFQESGVLPWYRDRLPLLFNGETKELVAVADLAVAAEYAAEPNEAAALVHWRDGPNYLAAETAAKE